LRDVVFSKEDVLLALASMCQFHRIPFDAALVLREFPPPYSLETLLHAARRLGFDVGASRRGCVAKTRDRDPSRGDHRQGER